MKIQVLGSGCAACKNLYKITQKAVSEMEIDAEVEYVTGSEGMKKIVELGAMSSPVLTVNGRIAMTGFTPDLEVIKGKIKKSSEAK